MEQRFGPYRVVRPLGAGGMGAVFEVEDPRGRRLALKTLLAGSGAAALTRQRQRFAREAELSARLRHPGVQAVIAADLHAPQPYLVVELLGESLEERLRGGALPLAEVLQLGLGLTRALRAAHAAGVVHRDLKPDNVLFRGAAPVLVDFGVAVSLSEDTLRITASGALVGTFATMSPEQARGRGDTPASDAYALGGILYRCLSGRPPLDLGQVSSLPEFMARLHSEAPRPLRELRPEAPPELARLVHELLAKAPEERPDLEQVEGRLEALRRPAAPRAAGLGWAIAAGTLLAALGLGAALGGGAGSARVAGSAAPGGSPGAGSAPATPRPSPTLRELRAAVARADYERALELASSHQEDPGSAGREARFLAAWSAYELGDEGRARLLVAPLEGLDDRWGLLARALVWPPEQAVVSRLAREHPRCVYAFTRRDAVEPNRALLPALTRFLEDPAAASFAPLWLLRARITAGLDQVQEARASLEQAERLAGRRAPPGSAPARGILALVQNDFAGAAAAYGEAARAHPGRFHIFRSRMLERLGRFDEARACREEGLRLARESYLASLARDSYEVPLRLRLRRYAGLAVVLDRSVGADCAQGAGPSELRRQLAAPFPAAVQPRVRALLTRAQQGEGYELLLPELMALRELLGAQPAWWQLEARVLISRHRLRELRATLDRALRLGVPRDWVVPHVILQKVLQGGRLASGRSRELAQQLGVDLLSTPRGRVIDAFETRDFGAVARHAEEALRLDPSDQVAALYCALTLRREASRVIARSGYLQRHGFLAAECMFAVEVDLSERALQQGQVAQLRRKLIAQEALALTFPETIGLAQAIRLACRLPEHDPWRASIPAWAHEAELLSAQEESLDTSPVLWRALGTSQLSEGGSQARVRDMWDRAARAGVRPTPWELARYRERFGVPYQAPERD